MHRARRPPGLPRAARAPPPPLQTLSPRFRWGRAAAGERGARPAAPHRAGLPPGDGGAARILPAQAVGKGREGGREEGTGWEMHMVAPRSREGRGRPGRGGRVGQGRSGPARRRPAKLSAVGKAGAPRPSRPAASPAPRGALGWREWCGMWLHLSGVNYCAWIWRKGRIGNPSREGASGRGMGRRAAASSASRAGGLGWGSHPRQMDPRCGSRRLRWALAGVTRPVGQALCGRAPGAESPSEPPSAAAAPRVRRDPRPGPAESARTCGTDGCSLSQSCVDEGAKCLSEACD